MGGVHPVTQAIARCPILKIAFFAILGWDSRPLNLLGFCFPRINNSQTGTLPRVFRNSISKLVISKLYSRMEFATYFPSTENASRTLPGISPHWLYPEFTNTMPPTMAAPPPSMAPPCAFNPFTVS